MSTVIEGLFCSQGQCNSNRKWDLHSNEYWLDLRNGAWDIRDGYPYFSVDDWGPPPPRGPFTREQDELDFYLSRAVVEDGTHGAGVDWSVWPHTF